jgi:hypothetical protein
MDRRFRSNEGDPAIVEPVDLVQRRELDDLEGPPRTVTSTL